MRKTERLTARSVAATTTRINDKGEPAERVYPDGNGLYLRVGPTGAKSWVLRYRFGGKRHNLGLGALEMGSGRGYTLAEARDRATEQRRLLRDKINPLKARRDAAIEQALTEAKDKTFAECAETYISEHEASWRGPKEAPQWRSSLRDHAYEKIGDMPVASIDTAAVLRVVEPIWSTKTETADRVRSRIERILAWATIKGYRTGDNPARWAGHLQAALAPVAKVARVEHHPALPYAEIANFMAELRRVDQTKARALEFLILTGARLGEVTKATWSEIDLERRLWTVGHMKMGKEHKVPLCERAMAILASVPRVGDTFRVFDVGDQTVRDCLNRFKRTDKDGQKVTVHGFRSTFRDWAYETTDFPRETVEHCLAHIEGSAAEQAYKRGEALEKRRRVMAAWADYCAGVEPAANVVPLRA